MINFPVYVTKHIKPVPTPVGKFSFLKTKRMQSFITEGPDKLFIHTQFN